MPAPVIINAAGGSAAGCSDAALARAFQAGGLAVDIQRVPPRRIASALDAAAAAAASDRERGGPGLLVAGGGDGTLNRAAQAALAHGLEFGVLPMGTRNHFAQDLGLPLDPTLAAGTIASSPARPVDVGWVGDALFLNNASIGLYPMAVKRRDGLVARLGLPRTLAMLVAMAGMLRRPPLLHVELAPASADEPPVATDTPLVFVGNNRYGASALAPQRRARLDEGRLLVLAPPPLHRLPLARLVWHALSGELHASDAVASWWTADLQIEAHLRRRFHGKVKRLAVGVDGERLVLQPPLRLRSDPGALRVRAPKPEGHSAG